MNRTVIIAGADQIDFWEFWTKPGSTVLELLMVIGILLAVALLAFLWVVYLKSPWRKRRAYPKGPTPPGAAEGGRRHRKRSSKLFRMLRRHRRHHSRRRHRHRRRPANPTLAQTGGLPPPRPEQPGTH